jgi:hypothetical protein
MDRPASLSPRLDRPCEVGAEEAVRATAGRQSQLRGPWLSRKAICSAEQLLASTGFTQPVSSKACRGRKGTVRRTPARAKLAAADSPPHHLAKRITSLGPTPEERHRTADRPPPHLPIRFLAKASPCVGPPGREA